MLKILLLIDCLGSGGAQRQMVGLAKLLQDRGYQINVIYYHPIYFYRSFLEEHHIPNEYVAGSENKIKRIFLITRAIRKFRPKVVISYLDSPNIIACLIKALGIKFRLIVSERNTSQGLSCSEKTKFLLFRYADSIVTNSYTQERFINNNFPNLGYKTKVITNFVDTDFFFPLNKEKREIIRILVVGRVSRQKNTLAFLQVIHILKREGFAFSVDWYGRVDDNTFTQCKAYIDSHQLDDVFTFHEPKNDIVNEYQQSDIFCLPSLYEGFPNVICEAMGCGLPILCSHVCDNPLLVEDGENGFLFDPNNIEDMADKMRIMLTLSHNQLKEMGTNSRLLAIERFSAQTFIKKYVDLIECK